MTGLRVDRLITLTTAPLQAQEELPIAELVLVLPSLFKEYAMEELALYGPAIVVSIPIWAGVTYGSLLLPKAQKPILEYSEVDDNDAIVPEPEPVFDAYLSTLLPPRTTTVMPP